MTVTTRDTSGTKRYYGLSSDTKPSSNVPTGSLFFETDTGLGYVYGGSAWSEVSTRVGTLVVRGPLPWADVRAYGATGNGTTDDTAAVQNAIWAASATGGTVYLPRGTYLVSSIETYNNVLMIGESTAMTTLKLKNATNDHLLYATSAGGLVIRDLTLDGNRANQSAGPSCCLFLTLCDYATFERVRFTGARTLAVALAGCRYYRAVQCRFDDSGLSVSGGDGLLWIGNSTTTYSTDGVVDRCLFVGRAAGPEGILVVSDRTTIINSTFLGNGTHQDASGIYVGNNVYDVRVENNYIDACGNYGIDFDFASTAVSYGAVVVGNVVRGCRQSGICAASNGAVLIGNQSLNNGQTINSTAPDSDNGHGILVDARNVTINGGRCTDTQVSKTQQYGIGFRNTSTVLDKTTVIGVDMEGNVFDGIRAIDFFAKSDLVFHNRTQGNRIGQHMLWTADNQYDMGASGATRPRTIYVGTSVITPALTLTGDLTLANDDTAVSTEAHARWRQSRAFLAVHDGTRERAIGDCGMAPYAQQPGVTHALAFSTAVNLAAVSAGNGGALAIPILVQGHMLVQSCTIWNTDTASARTAEWRLFEDRRSASNSVNEISALNGTWSFTPGAASARASNASTPGTYLAPGLYWLVIRNTSAAQTFGVGSAAAGATPLGNTGQTKAIAALGSTLDMVAATWTKTTALYGVRLDGRQFAETAAF